MFKQQKFYEPADDQAGGTFCPNCGQRVKATDAFCENCGFDLTAFRNQSSQTNADHPSAASRQATPAQPTQSATPTAPTRQSQAKRSMPKWAWLTIGVVLVLAIGGYAYGQHYYQPAAQLNRAITALKTGKGLAKQVTSTDPSLKITPETVKPMSAYFKANRKSLASLASDLKASNTANQYGVQFVRTGKAWLFFDKYQLQVASVYADLSTNHKNVTLAVNGKKVAKTTATNLTHKVGPYVPGTYTLTAKGTVGQHQITNKGTYYLRSTGESYELDLRTISLTVVGTPKTVIYVNGEKQGTIHSDGTLALNNLPWSNKMMMTGKYEVGNQLVTSKQTNLSNDEGEDVAVNFAGVMSKDSATDYITAIFDALGRYTNTGDLSDASDYNDRTLDDYFINGTDNADYQELVKMAKGYYDNDDIMSVNYEPTVISTIPAANDKSEITYDVKYDFTNTEEERIQVFRYTATVEKSGGHYKISKISAAQKIRDFTSSDDSDEGEND